MVIKEEKISKSRKVFNIIFFIVCAIFCILVISAIHFKVLTEIQPGYLYNVYLINFLWIDILIGLGIGLVLFIVIGIILNYYWSLKETETSAP
ncbi:MAG: hypothetical protein ACFE9M_13450 [Promethearchaeota archaeon]